MRPFDRWRHYVIIPLLIFGYIETLRRATFVSFGLVTQGYAFSILTGLIIGAVVLDMYSRGTWVKVFYKLFSALYLFAVLFFNYVLDSVAAVGIGRFLFTLPLLSKASSNPGKADIVFLFIFIFYAVLIYLVTYYVLERKNITELTAASAFLLGVEIATSKVDLTPYVIAHVIFILVLRSQMFYAYLLTIQTFFDFRPSREFGRSWVLINLIVTIIVVCLALIIPSRGTGVTITAQPVNWVKGKVVKSVTNLTNPAPSNQQATSGDRFHVYWNRIEKFEVSGNVQNSDNLVMSVKSPKPYYWRGETADYYNGSGWANTFELNETNEGTLRVPNPYGSQIPVERAEQVFTLAPDLTTTVVFSANVVAEVDVPDKVIWSDEAGNHYTKEMKSGATYKAVSYIPQFNNRQLRRAKRTNDPTFIKKYLQLPETLPDRVRDKAKAITKGLVNPYDKVESIERYLSKTYPYTMEVKPPEKGRDVVDYFLFDLKKGYCTYHSTAMVVLVRSLGIPARWVKGFATGTYDVGSGTYMVKESDAHAWVEVYFGDHGWVPFEPTATFQMPAVQDEPKSVSQTGDREEADTTTGENVVIDVKQGEEEQFGTVKNAGFGFVLILTVGFVIRYWLSLRARLYSLRINRVRDFYLDLMYLLEGKGYSRSHNQTPYEFAWSIRDQFPTVHTEILLLTEGYLREQYGNHKVTEKQYEQFKKAWETIIAALVGR